MNVIIFEVNETIQYFYADSAHWTSATWDYFTVI